ncbi:SGNH/GDSL hydrolase family protein, partial [bacterium]|nr:SGNH/GDSL hydrolase family protein [bacterium]
MTTIFKILLVFLLFTEIFFQIAVLAMAEEVPWLDKVIKTSNLKDTRSKENFYFLGDSNTYGMGASSPEYSFPNLLQGFLKQHHIQGNCINLAYPASNSYQHLKALLKVNPKDSIIILQSGMHDIHQFKFRYLLELESGFNKMFLANITYLFNKQAMVHKIQSLILKRFDIMAQKNQLKIVTMDYWWQNEVKMHIHNRDTLLTTEYLKLGGFFENRNIKSEYISIDKLHLNDFGY